MLPTGKMYDNSDETLVKYGKTYMCSNDGPRMKYSPCWFPIKGITTHMCGLGEHYWRW
jgi:hypothetical protein